MNHRAHVFYERNGFRIVGHHYVKYLQPIRRRRMGEATGQGSTGERAHSDDACRLIVPGHIQATFRNTPEIPLANTQHTGNKGCTKLGRSLSNDAPVRCIVLKNVS
jgi:hypothetical protein